MRDLSWLKASFILFENQHLSLMSFHKFWIQWLMGSCSAVSSYVMSHVSVIRSCGQTVLLLSKEVTWNFKWLNKKNSYWISSKKTSEPLLLLLRVLIMDGQTLKLFHSGLNSIKRLYSSNHCKGKAFQFSSSEIYPK